MIERCSAEDLLGTALYAIAVDTVAFHHSFTVASSDHLLTGAEEGTSTSLIEIEHAGNALNDTSADACALSTTCLTPGAMYECSMGSSLRRRQFTTTTRTLKFTENVSEWPYTTAVAASPKLLYSFQLWCSHCAANTYSLEAGTSSAASVTCKECPAGALCAGAGNIVAGPEKWIDVSAVTHVVSVLECPRCEGCIAGLDRSVDASDQPVAAAASISHNCLEAQTRNWCGVHRIQPTSSSPNPLCGACIRNATHTFIEFGEGCVECSEVQWRNIALAAVGAVVYVLILRWMAAAVVSQPLFKVVVYFLQILGLVLGPMHTWAPVLAVLGDLDVLRFFCFGPMTSLQRLWLNLLMPLVYFVALFAVSGACRALAASRRCRVVNNGGDDDDAMLLVSAANEKDWAAESTQRVVVLWRAVAFLMLFGYQTWTEQSLELLHCISVSGTLVIAEHPDVECSGPDYSRLVVGAVCIIVVVVVGLPMGMLVYLYRNAHQFDHESFRGRSGVLYEHYINSIQVWWQPQELLRRTMLIGMSVATSQRQAIRSWLLGAGCGVIFAVHVWVKPYQTPRQGWRKLVDPNVIEALTLFMLMIAAFTGLFMVEGEEDADGLEILVGALLILLLIFSASGNMITKYWRRKVASEREHTRSAELEVGRSV